ncbi:MAG: hypothetical protein V2A67_01635, partial [Bacteroidota bacterium]
MKTKFKVFFAAIFFVGAAGSAFTQEAVNATASITAEISYLEEVDILFGSIAVSTSPAINPSTGAATNCGAGAHAGRVKVMGTG